MNRTGWAAAVGSLYKTRGGHLIRVTQYSVSWDGSAIRESLMGLKEPKLPEESYWTFDGHGSCTTSPDNSSTGNPDFDLISAVQPAQVTKIIKCKNDLATRPQEGTAPATVVPRKDLP